MVTPSVGNISSDLTEAEQGLNPVVFYIASAGCKIGGVDLEYWEFRKIGQRVTHRFISLVGCFR